MAPAMESRIVSAMSSVGGVLEWLVPGPPQRMAYWCLVLSHPAALSSCTDSVPLPLKWCVWMVACIVAWGCFSAIDLYFDFVSGCRDCHFPKEIVSFRRFRPGSGRKPIFCFYFGLKRSRDNKNVKTVRTFARSRKTMAGPP